MNNTLDTTPDLFGYVAPSKKDVDKKPLKNVRFALLGKFSYARSILQGKIVKLGGDDKITLSKDTRVVVMGKLPSEKEIEKLDTLNHDGFKFPIITEDDFMSILKGESKDFKFPAVTKNVDIDYNFIFNPKYKCLIPISKDGITHCLGAREIFVHKGGDKIGLFWQIIGNLSGSATNRFDPCETKYIMLEESTVKDLRNGVKDDLIKLIEDTYNVSKSDKFIYKFILEDEFKSFAKSRSEKVNDNVTLDLIDRYEKR